MIIQHIKKATFKPDAFLHKSGLGRKMMELQRKQVLFSQGDPANAVFYIQKGKVKLTVISKRGKEATVALLGGGISWERNALPPFSPCASPPLPVSYTDASRRLLDASF
jgi:Cyclic nucleotide-binding domain